MTPDKKVYFDGTSDYLSRGQDITPSYSVWINGKCESKAMSAETYTIVFKKPLSKKKWRKMSKKYGINVAVRMHK